MKDTLNTIYIVVVYGFFLILSILLFIPYSILKLFRPEESFKHFIHWASKTWGGFGFIVNRSKKTVTGLENLPNHTKIMYICNHQGYGDIPLMMASLPTTIGFIAKKELGKVPILGLWMRAIHCTFLDRGNFRKAMREIETGIEEVTNGFPMVIFPEGTRSRCEKMLPFKSGGILLAAKAGLTIVPITINGTYKLYEEKRKIVPASVSLTIHPYIDTQDMDEDEQKELTGKLWQTIASGLPDKGN